MASDIPASVTIDRQTFETLLRRAQFHIDGDEKSNGDLSSTITIPKNYHDNLLRESREYANLLANLRSGGVTEEHIQVLIQTPEGTDRPVESIQQPTNGRALLDRQSSLKVGYQPYLKPTFRNGESFRPRDNLNNTFHKHNHCQLDEDSLQDGPSDKCYNGGGWNNTTQAKPSRPQYEKNAQRTVLLRNLPEGVTHAEVTDMVRGGMLLDIYIRDVERVAQVSFLETEHAKNFIQHCQKHDVYIRSKRVEAKWNQRQFILPSHIANKIGIGATRNLVIFNHHQKHTEGAIRDDLEHIHNLVVIKVSFEGGNAYIETNSVHNALFARTCMMSRSVYKGYKIEWDDDECASPLVTPLRVREPPNAPKTKAAPPTNRFAALDIDGTENGSEEGEEEFDTSGVSLPTNNSPSTSRW